MSKRSKAFQLFSYSDPRWVAIVIPVAGCSGDSAVVASRIDRYTGKQMYGQVLATYASKKRAENLARNLNEYKSRLAAAACL